MSREPKSQSDVAAGRLGELLLKGYRMLDAACPQCNTLQAELSSPCDMYRGNVLKAVQSTNIYTRETEHVNCTSVQTVIMQDRYGKNICVLCPDESSKTEPAKQELPIVADCEMHKVEPAVTSGRTMDVEVREAEPEVQRCIDAVLNEMSLSANHLVQNTNSGISSIGVRQELLRHIQLCANVLKDLKSS